MVMRPSPGEITSPYGWRTHPVTGVRTHHNGVDMGWGNGWDIVAPEPGVVVAYHVRGIENYGRRLDLLGDSGTLHYFAHTSRAYVTSGRVTEGQKVAVIGNTGLSAFPHLHWETRLDGKTLTDPMVWLDSFNTPAGVDPTPFPPTPEEEEDKDMKMKGAAYVRAKDNATVFLLFNEISGFWSEHTGVGGDYNNSIARTWDTGSWPTITESHANVLKQNLNKVRTRAA